MWSNTYISQSSAIMLILNAEISLTHNFCYSVHQPVHFVARSFASRMPRGTVSSSVHECNWVYLSIPECIWVYPSVPECTWVFRMYPSTPESSMPCKWSSVADSNRRDRTPRRHSETNIRDSYCQNRSSPYEYHSNPEPKPKPWWYIWGSDYQRYDIYWNRTTIERRTRDALSLTRVSPL